MVPSKEYSGMTSTVCRLACVCVLEPGMLYEQSQQLQATPEEMEVQADENIYVCENTCSRYAAMNQRGNRRSKYREVI